MPDALPGIVFSTSIAILGGVLKVVGELIKWRTARRMKDAYAKTAPAVAPQLPATVSPALEAQLQAKEIELLRAKYQIEELQQALRRLRLALDEAAEDQAQLAAAISAERWANDALLAEMAELRKEGSNDVRTPTADSRPRDGRHLRGDLDGGSSLRETDRPQRIQGRRR